MRTENLKMPKSAFTEGYIEPFSWKISKIKPNLKSDDKSQLLY